MSNSERGSQWNRWDLHVHTPCSIVQDYGGDKKEVWDNYITQLESLPEDIKAIGINDYLFLDGYKKIIEYKKRGRLKNIELILPVIELRIEEFVGHEKLNKINYHVIFSNELDPEVIEKQFIAGLTIEKKYMLTTGLEGKEWKGLLNHESLADFGSQIINTTPDNKKSTCSPEEVGFNNIAFSLDRIETLLKENSYLKDKYVTAIGKSEWNDFRWDGSAAKKRTIANSVDIIFTASETPEKACESSSSLHEEGVNYRIIHCSDAHSFRNEGNESTPKRLGHCFTWIKSDLTFCGLTQIKYDYLERVKIQRDNPYTNNTKYVIDSVSFMDYDSDRKGVIKPQTIYLNRDLTTIIGSKGSGKSLLLSSLSSISNENKYKKHDIFDCDDNIRGQRMDVQLITKESSIVEKNGVELNASGDDDQFTEPVLYIGQEELSERSKNKDMVREECLSEIGILDTSLAYNDIHNQISYAVDRLIKTEDDREKLCGSLNITDNVDPEEFINKKIESLKNAQEKLTDKNTKNIIDSVAKIIADGKNISIWKDNNKYEEIRCIAESYNAAIDVFREGLADVSSNLKSPFEKIDLADMNKKYNQISKSVDELRNEKRKAYLHEKKKLEELGIKEDVPTLLKTIENSQNELIKYEKKLNDVKTNSQLIASLREKISAFFDVDSGAICIKLNFLLEDMMKKVKNFEDDHKGSNIFNVLFSDISVLPKIFFNYRKLEKDIAECFYSGKAPDLRKNIFGDKTIDYKIFFQWVKEDFWSFLKENEDNLLSRIAGRNTSGRERILEIILTQWHVYTYVSVDIYHQFLERKKEINEMSTGELATVLLKLILITKGLDKQIILIDQPEDNLDNDFIANGLVNLVKQLKKVRQLIIVTHNANLVVMTDSEEVIVAKGIRNKYLSGGIEKDYIRDEIIRILEGGPEAFRLRSERYHLEAK